MTSMAPAENLHGYVAGLRAVVNGFPDYRWELRHLLVDGQGLAARLSGAGTHTGHFHGIAATGRAIRTQELAIYRVADDKTHRESAMFHGGKALSQTGGNGDLRLPGQELNDTHTQPQVWQNTRRGQRGPPTH